MKKLAVLALLAAGVFIGYRLYDSSRAPVKAYQAFAEEVLHRRYDAAAAMTDGLSQRDLAKRGTQEQIGTRLVQHLFPSKFEITSKRKSSDGTVKIDAMQTVLFNPVGVESALRPAMFAKMKQAVTLRKIGGAWKVASFENEFQKMDSVTR